MNPNPPDTNLFYHLIQCRNSINQVLAQQFNYVDAPTHHSPYSYNSTSPDSFYYPSNYPSHYRRNVHPPNYRNEIGSLIRIMDQLQHLNDTYNLQNTRRTQTPFARASRASFPSNRNRIRRPSTDNIFSFLNPNFRNTNTTNTPANGPDATETRIPRPTPNEPPNNNTQIRILQINILIILVMFLGLLLVI